MAYETIEVRIEADKVGVITLNRPKQLNALNDQLMDELGDALLAPLNEAMREKYGLEMTSFVVENVSVPPELDAPVTQVKLVRDTVIDVNGRRQKVAVRAIDTEEKLG